ncbi:MAG: abortive infection family protein [Phycisphaerae bacterium]|nr:abortive infection family protein [Phycisphaerae bacterium]
MKVDEQRISEVTRRRIFDQLALERIPWSGRLNEPDFLARLYNLKGMGSTDHRFGDAYGDIWQHRVRNLDWEPDWVFTDRRFDLLRCPDERVLRFLCETMHPVVQPDEGVVGRLLGIFNDALANDGFQIVETTQISGQPVFAPCETIANPLTLGAAKAIAQVMSADYLSLQITRMQTSIHGDPELAIGTAKELIETCCKTILRERSKPFEDTWEVPKLVRATLEVLNLVPDNFPKEKEASDSIRKTLGNLAQLAQGAAELRKIYGTGHGKDASTTPPHPHLARLAVGAASTLAVFLFERHRLEAL